MTFSERRQQGVLQCVHLRAVAIFLVWSAASSVLADGAEVDIRDPERSFKEVLEAWNSWKQAVNSVIPLGEFKSEFRPPRSGRSPSRTQFGRDGSHYYQRTSLTIRGVNSEFVTIANPRYAAAISRPGSGEWRITSLSPRDKIAENPQLSLFLKTNPVDQALSPTPMVGEFLAKGRYRIVKATRVTSGGDASTQKRRRFVLEPRSAQESPIRRLVITVSEDCDLLPVEFSVTQVVDSERQPGEQTTDVFKIGDWKKQDDVWKWSRAAWVSTTGSVEYVWTIPSPHRRLDRKWCYLSHYGLPEPDLNVRGGRWMWFVVGLVALAGGVLAAVFRFRR